MCALGNKPVILTFGLLHSRFLIFGNNADMVSFILILL